MKTLITICLLLSIMSCKKPSNNNSNNGNTSSLQDKDNYFTINGVTNYHYSYPNMTTVSCSNQIYFWYNGNNTAPDCGAQIMLANYFLSSISHFKNGLITTYYPRIWKPLPSRVVNGYTVIEFTNIKAYTSQLDTTLPFVYVSGKITCNGK